MVVGAVFRAGQLEPLVVGQSVAVVVLAHPDDAGLRLVAEGVALDAQVVVGAAGYHAVVEAGDEVAALSAKAHRPLTAEVGQHRVAGLLVGAVVGIGFARDDVAVHLVARGGHVGVDAVDHGLSLTAAAVGAGGRTDVDIELLLLARGVVGEHHLVGALLAGREDGAQSASVHVGHDVDGAPLGHVDARPGIAPSAVLRYLGQFSVLGLLNGYLHFVAHYSVAVAHGQLDEVDAGGVGREGVVRVVANGVALHGPGVDAGLVQVLDVGHELYAFARLDAEAARRHDPRNHGQRAFFVLRCGIVFSARHQQRQEKTKTNNLINHSSKVSSL